MAGAASQAGDADSSRAPGLAFGLQGSVIVHRGALLLVPQWQCISSLVFYIWISILFFESGHLVPSLILGLANAPIVETKFLELAMSLLDFSPRIPLGTFSVLPLEEWSLNVIEEQLNLKFREH